MDDDSTDELKRRVKARVGNIVREKYRLDRVIGVGGMAAVYAATHRNGKEFAVKMLHTELSLSSEVRTRFLREGYLANKVKHRGAVSAIDDDVTEDGTAFLVMELLEGESVEAACETSGGRLSFQAITAIALQALEVLDAAHAQGVVHRDIKPANLFISLEGEVKVLDFGIARLRDVAASHATRSGLSMGTPAFMAPEQALGRVSEMDARTDVWAVGATMFALATGEIVHEAQNAQEIMIYAGTRPSRPLGPLVGEAQGDVAGIIAVIDRALAFKRDDRWESAGAMRVALEAAAERAFESVPGREWLSAIVGPHHAAKAAASYPVPMRDFVQASTVEVASAAELQRDWPPAPAHTAGMATAQPVSSDRQLETVAIARPARPRGPLWVGGGVLGVLVVGGGFFLHTLRGEAPRAAVPSVAPPASQAAAVPRGVPAVSTEPPPPVSAAPSTVSPVALLPASHPAVASPTVTQSPSLLPKPSPHPAATSTAAPPPTTAVKPGCNPDFTLDTSTTPPIKHFKPECFPDPPNR